MGENELQILVVEDNDGHIGLIRRAFNKAGPTWHLTLAGSVAEAREALAREAFNLVLADLVLPDGRGTELLAPKTEQVSPVVIMTSCGDETAAVEAMKGGALDYLVKSQAAFTALPRTCESILRRWDDIVQRRQAEQALRKSEEEFRTLIQNIPGAVYRCDLEPPWHMHHMSEAIVQVTGYPLSRFTGSTRFAYGELILEEDREYVAREVKEGIAGRRPFDLEYRIRHADGGLRWVFERGRALYDQQGSPVCLDGVIIDVTARKRVEEELARAKVAAEAASQAKSMFLANMSHEIRTPMTAILGFADLLMSVPLAPHERREHLATIRRNAESLLAVINDVLDLSKIEASKLDLELIPCAIWDLIDDVRATMADRAEAKGLALEVHYDYPLPGTVRTDPSRLRQILINLVGNAVKFTDKGSIRVSVRCDASNGSGRMLLITVTDTGVGISPQEMEQLFQPFTQGDMSTTRRFGGTGLGLAISQRLARMLGGCIEVNSRVGHGSSFCVTVDPGPLENVAWISAAPVLQHRADAFKPSRPANLSGTVLLAEDALDVRSLIAAVLGQMGLTVETAANGREAIDRAIAAQQSGRPYDLILMDMQMPVCDGYQATRSLRDAGFPGQIVALTAHAMTGDRQKCLDAGCNDYLPKPIKSDELAAAVSRYLQIPYLPDSSPAATATASSGRPTGCLIDSKYFTPSARQKLLKGFIDGLPERIEKIQSALASRDVDSLIQTVHALHGTAGLYGYERMAKMALDVEEQARQGAAPTQVEALARDLLQICTETRLTFPEP